MSTYINIFQNNPSLTVIVFLFVYLLLTPIWRDN